MGTISSGIGLISGLDIQDLVTQLMAIESRPHELIKTRIEGITVQQTALMSLQARIMALQVNAASFNKESVFNQKAVTSSDENVITASASNYAACGTYRFIIKRLASNHHFISRGYSSLNSGVGTGAITFEIGNGQLNRPTELSFINGQQGFERGEITITDRAGHTGRIDLSTVLTMQDVLAEINKNTEVQVTAAVSGDRLVITDNSTGAGVFSISGAAAESLGIEGIAGADQPHQIIGRDIVYLTADTGLRQLNDGNSVRGLGFGDDLIFHRAGEVESLFSLDLKDTLFETVGDPDASNTLQSLNGGNGVRLGKFRITDRNGKFIDIDLNELTAEYGPRVTLGHVKEFIQQKIDEKNERDNPSSDPDFKGMSISITFTGTDHLTIKDNSEPVIPEGEAYVRAEDLKERKSHFIIEDLEGGFTAADLGIIGDVEGENIHGENIWRMDSLGDLVSAINYHWSNWDPTAAKADKRYVIVELDQDGNGLSITNNTAEALTLEDTAAAADLGLVNSEGFTGVFTGRRLIAGLNTVLLSSLNGGSAGSNQITTEHSINLTDRSGQSVQVDLTGLDTVQEVFEAINQAATNITASVNQAGNGIILTDDHSPAGGSIAVSGDLAEKLNIAVSAGEGLGRIDSGNLQLQYISEAARLTDLRAGRGVQPGKFKVTDGDGVSKTIDLFRDDVKTLQDVIDAFAGSGTNLRARINDTGDGLLVYDEISTGGGAIKIEEIDGHTARDLGILGTARQGENFIDGSYEFKLEMGGGDTIEDLAARLNQADIGVTCSVINDGSGDNPYRISFTSLVSGRVGRVYLDAGTTNLTTRTLASGDDAIVLFGEGAASGAVLITSSTNTIENAVKGTTLELVGVSDTPVDISVAQDLDGIIAQIKNFVESYNSIMEDIAEKDRFDPETLERGVLFGEHAVDTVRDVLQSVVRKTVPGLSASMNSLSDVGIRPAPFGTETATNEQNEEIQYAVVTTPKLEFDEDKFRAVFAENPEAAAELFTKAETGIGDWLADRLEGLAGSTDSTIKYRLDAMQSQQNMLEDRAEYLEVLLQSKEERLYQQFYAMEQALASLQSQQAALASLSSLAASWAQTTRA
ncbi:MAG: hypothetical protein AMJ79_03040 [Phycisphaerae bacterium SM23_30]|nr:MAG: hypothetical protein AMJ79_03040 [Phycisphaerae bacterium SM23_30]